MGRTQAVKFNNNISISFTVCSGVPQGSHCTLIHFNLFVNDIAGKLKNSNALMFTDDLKLYRTMHYGEDAPVS